MEDARSRSSFGKLTLFANFKENVKRYKENHRLRTETEFGIDHFTEIEFDIDHFFPLLLLIVDEKFPGSTEFLNKLFTKLYEKIDKGAYLKSLFDQCSITRGEPYTLESICKTITESAKTKAYRLIIGVEEFIVIKYKKDLADYISQLPTYALKQNGMMEPFNERARVLGNFSQYYWHMLRSLYTHVSNTPTNLVSQLHSNDLIWKELLNKTIESDPTESDPTSTIYMATLIKLASKMPVSKRPLVEYRRYYVVPKDRYGRVTGYPETIIMYRCKLTAIHDPFPKFLRLILLDIMEDSGFLPHDDTPTFVEKNYLKQENELIITTIDGTPGCFGVIRLHTNGKTYVNPKCLFATKEAQSGHPTSISALTRTNLLAIVNELIERMRPPKKTTGIYRSVSVKIMATIPGWVGKVIPFARLIEQVNKEVAKLPMPLKTKNQLLRILPFAQFSTLDKATTFNDELVRILEGLEDRAYLPWLSALGYRILSGEFLGIPTEIIQLTFQEYVLEIKNTHAFLLLQFDSTLNDLVKLCEDVNREIEKATSLKLCPFSSLDLYILIANNLGYSIVRDKKIPTPREFDNRLEILLTSLTPEALTKLLKDTKTIFTRGFHQKSTQEDVDGVADGATAADGVSAAADGAGDGSPDADYIEYFKRTKEYWEEEMPKLIMDNFDQLKRLIRTISSNMNRLFDRAKSHYTVMPWQVHVAFPSTKLQERYAINSKQLAETGRKDQVFLKALKLLHFLNNRPFSYLHLHPNVPSLMIRHVSQRFPHFLLRLCLPPSHYLEEQTPLMFLDMSQKGAYFSESTSYTHDQIRYQQIILERGKVRPLVPFDEGYRTFMQLFFTLISIEFTIPKFREFLMVGSDLNKRDRYRGYLTMFGDDNKIDVEKIKIPDRYKPEIKRRIESAAQPAPTQQQLAKSIDELIKSILVSSVESELFIRLGIAQEFFSTIREYCNKESPDADIHKKIIALHNQMFRLYEGQSESPPPSSSPSSTETAVDNDGIELL